MKLRISYIDNEINIDNDTVNCLEIENRGCFYKVINDFCLESSGQNTESLFLIDDLSRDINVLNKFVVIIDYFNLEQSLKKYSSVLEKNIIMSINEKDKFEFTTIASKLAKVYERIISDIDLPLKINFLNDINYLTKIMKTSFSLKSSILENLLLLIDIEKVFNLNKFFVFVNLKQYLSKDELLELYKYSIYNNVSIILIDSQSYGGTIKYEKKIIIDKDYDEFVIV